MAAKQFDVYLTDSDHNTDTAQVDDLVLERGADEPVQLTQKQIDRLKDAGARLRVEDPTQSSD